MKMDTLLKVTLTALLGISLLACPQRKNSRTCLGDGLCVEPDGQLVLDDGRPACELDGTCDGGDGMTGDATTGDEGMGDNSGGDGSTGNEACGQCTASATDSDGDCIPNDVESLNGHSDPNLADTDGDGISDGCEDLNNNGRSDPLESSPTSSDTDGDGIPDNLEDRDLDGRRDTNESSAVLSDTDADGIPDGTEDRNQDGFVDAFVDANNDGCWNPGETAGESAAFLADSDGDGIADGIEDANGNGLPDTTDTNSDGFADQGETVAFANDSDCDGLQDGAEDRNLNGQINTDETDPLNRDTDADGLLDGIEDTNGNGAIDLGETDPLSVDSDGDGVRDGAEDLNLNGIVDTFTDTNGNGCWDADEPPGESDPANNDSDGDGILDGIEDRNLNGVCDVSPTAIQGSFFLESCAYSPDTDCDGIDDGVEDANRNGFQELGETDAINADTDQDGVLDGCNGTFVGSFCGEDTNNNGITELSELNPLVFDTDGDGLNDGCEPVFSGGSGTLDPLNADTDADGLSDGDEDADQDCLHEPDAPDNETDPSTFDDPPAVGTQQRAEFEVCATQNLKPLTFLTSERATHDMRLALEVEFSTTGQACVDNTNCNTNAGEICSTLGLSSAQCQRPAPYIAQPFGKDLDNDGLSETDLADRFAGYVYQSPSNVVDGTFGTTNRDIYGFVYVTTLTGGGSLDDFFDAADGFTADLRNAYSELTEISSLTARPAHDNLTASPVLFNQRVFEIETTQSGVYDLRNRMLRDIVTSIEDGCRTNSDQSTCEAENGCAWNELDGACGFNNTGAVGPDPVYGAAQAPVNTKFVVSFSGVLRSNVLALRDTNGVLRTDGNGDPILILVGSMTQNDSASTTIANAPEKLSERELRLVDLTGGSSVARFSAQTSSSCEEKPQQRAVADIIWVVDDSRSMQQIIEKLRVAARDAAAVLTANSGIVDSRVALTTTNASSGARIQCADYCENDCGQADCNSVCPPSLGCIKACSNNCDTGCGNLIDCNLPTQTTCNMVTGCSWNGMSCEDECSIMCTDGCCDGACTTANQGKRDVCGSTCIGENGIAAASLADVSDYPLPGGGGTFYWEDTQTLDCDSFSAGGATEFIQPCPGGSGEAFAPFYASGSRNALFENRGLIATDPTASCATALLDLSADAADPMAASACISNPERCCERLTAACSDGPTVFASQVCNLIREMGGLPQSSGATTTSGARAHSSPEFGTRSARRLLAKMLPALPADAVSSPGTSCPTNQDSECGPGERCYDHACYAGNFNSCTQHSECTGDDLCLASTCRTPVTKFHLRLTCDRNEAGCVPCDPRTDTNCPIAPMVTIFLSDEEAYYFKDECRGVPGQEGPDRLETDRWQLPEKCYYMDGSGEPQDCTRAYCEAPNWSTPGMPERDRNAPLRTGIPSGYDPDSSQRTLGRGHTLAWRSESAPECSSNRTDWSVTCNTNPCEAIADQTTCEASDARMSCFWSNNRCRNQCEIHSVPCNDFGGDANLCAAAGARCQFGATCSNALSSAQERLDVSQTNCESDSYCRWDQEIVGGNNASRSCQPLRPLNDCGACKRFLRLEEALEGDSTLPGLALKDQSGTQHGYVYAVVRNQGVEGFGSLQINGPQDTCRGGAVTWGLGDGGSYRQLSRATFGRTQDVCADDYQDFLQAVVTDIATLSAPYALTEAPISATIKVGIARPNGGAFDFIDVARSNTVGFVYSASENSVGFVTTPLDGVCENVTVGPGECVVDGTIDARELESATRRETVPRENDIVYISYRTWEPVPCRGECGIGETCVRLTCPTEANPTSCTGPNECTGGRTCIANECRYDCTPPSSVDVCLPRPECPSCFGFEPSAANPDCGLIVDQGTCDADTGCQWNPTLGRCDKNYCVEVSTTICNTLTDPSTCNAEAGCLFNTASSVCESVFGAGCACQATGLACNPSSINACPPGLSCGASCGCSVIPACNSGFNSDGSVTDCGAAIACCDALAVAPSICAPLDQVSCNGDPFCSWNGSSCEAAFNDARCCLSGENAVCASDPETGTPFLVCVSQQLCTCNPTCNPQTEFCGVSAMGSCECLPNPL